MGLIELNRVGSDWVILGSNGSGKVGSGQNGSDRIESNWVVLGSKGSG